MDKKILLTFDVEEFDLPEEYNAPIEKSEQLNVSSRGLTQVLALLRKHRVVATFFTTAFYAENFPCQIQALVSEGHEVASHLYYHSDYNPEHIRESRKKLEEITKQKVWGFRTPRLRPMDPELIKAAGYMYDSSLNPTFLPGRYNNFSRPRTHFRENGMHILPFSVSPGIRFPLFWLSFKNINFPAYLWLCRQTLRHDRYLHLYFHPWEFTNLDVYRIPWYIKNRSGDPLLRRLDLLIQNLGKEGGFATISEFLNDRVCC